MNGTGHEIGNNAYWPYLHHHSVGAQSPQNANQSDPKCKAAVSITADKKHTMYRYTVVTNLSGSLPINTKLFSYKRANVVEIQCGAKSLRRWASRVSGLHVGLGWLGHGEESEALLWARRSALCYVQLLLADCAVGDDWGTRPKGIRFHNLFLRIRHGDSEAKKKPHPQKTRVGHPNSFDDQCRGHPQD
jgi:hypothetical protein